MRLSRGSTIVFMLGAGMLAVATFSVKYQVQALDEELQALNHQIENDRRAIHVLEAEWSHLNDPRRLRSLARSYLGLEPVTAENLTGFQDLPDKLEAASPKSDATPEGQQLVGGEKPLPKPKAQNIALKDRLMAEPPAGITDESWAKAIEAVLTDEKEVGRD